jgi:HEAT repeat protein
MPLIRKKAESVPFRADRGEGDGAMPSDTADARRAAARAATRAGDGVQRLSAALAIENDPRVREAIFTALACIATAESAAVVVEYIRSDNAAVRTGALDALRAMPNAAGRYLRSLMDDDDGDVRILSCELARDARIEGATDLLMGLLERDQSSNVCASVIESLAEIGDDRALPALTRCAERFPNDPFIAFAVDVARSRLGTRDTTPRG